MKLDYDRFVKLMSFNICPNRCIEICFDITNELKREHCWLGKMPEKSQKNQVPVFWMGLTPDGTNAFDFDNLTDFLEKKVVFGYSLKELWADIDIVSIDGVDPKIALEWYE